MRDGTCSTETQKNRKKRRDPWQRVCTKMTKAERKGNFPLTPYYSNHLLTHSSSPRSHRLQQRRIHSHARTLDHLEERNTQDRTERYSEKRSALYNMASLIQALLDWLRSLFFKTEMELTLVGLQNSGKTTLVNVIASGQFQEDMIPTVGFNMRKVSKGNVTMKLWDIGGQPRFRSMWERYCRGVNAIVFVIDSADHDKLDAARTELRNLLDKPQLASIPVLVLGNKNDLPGALTVDQIIEVMNLKQIASREVSCYSISAKNQVNIDITLQWLIKKGKGK
ncbi:hypothetical protein KVV02_006351 [Mortierella alpina]|uniref:ADP-ribosylation factor-like protein 8B n=1 Tax=Mortierella alpina TaxID=64518 RepID=A0A9P8IFT7_MORAP|nr:hypothetical protein KVV02_006351 [Mortierella alpina]